MRLLVREPATHEREFRSDAGAMGTISKLSHHTSARPRGICALPCARQRYSRPLPPEQPISHSEAPERIKGMRFGEDGDYTVMTDEPGMLMHQLGRISHGGRGTGSSSTNAVSHFTANAIADCRFAKYPRSPGEVAPPSSSRSGAPLRLPTSIGHPRSQRHGMRKRGATSPLDPKIIVQSQTRHLYLAAIATFELGKNGVLWIAYQMRYRRTHNRRSRASTMRTR
jgi:hypothetical protein